MLGPLTVTGGDHASVLGPVQRRLLALLAVRAGRVVAVDQISDVLGLGSPGAVRTAVSRLRRTVGDVVRNVPPGYVLEPGCVDARRFEDALRSASRMVAADAVEVLGDALALWRGPAFVEFADEEWARGEAGRLDELACGAVEDRIEALVVLGRPAEAAAEAQVLAVDQPLRERVRGLQMRALAMQGRVAEAVRVFRQFRRHLRDEVGLEPSAQLAALERSILDGEIPTAGLPTAAPVARAPLNGPTTDTDVPFVGRADELAELGRWWAGSDDGSRMAVVLGEAGIGKTRLVSEFARRVQLAGGTVFYGRALEFGASAYEPLLGVLRQFVGTAGDDVIAGLSDTASSAIARLVPEMFTRRPDATALAAAWADVDRSWLLDAVADAFAPPGSSELLVVLDDLQWADQPALLLLARLLEPDRAVRVLATYRQPGGPPTTDLPDLAARVRRHGRSIVRVPVGGLRCDAVIDLLAALAGAGLSEAGVRFAAELHDRTGGHPLFVHETLRHLEDTGHISLRTGRWTAPPLEQVDVAEGVADVVAQRLNELSPETRTILQIAAVIGVEFDLAVLSAAFHVDTEEAIAAVEEAVERGLVAEDAIRVDHYRFVHAVIRDVVLARLSRSRRARVERRVGEAIEAVWAAGLDPWAGRLAEHFGRSAEIGCSDKAFEWALRAAEQARSLAAHEDAVRYNEMALHALQLVDGPADERHVDILLALGRAANLAGDGDRWRSACSEAVAIAGELGDPDRRAHAAIDLLGSLSAPGGDATVIGALEGAADAIRAEPLTAARTALLAEVLARLSAYLVRDPHRSPPLAVEALELARRSGERRVLAVALVNSVQTTVLEPDDHRVRLREAVELAHGAGDAEVVLRATSGLIHAALVWADRDEYERALAEYAHVAGTMRASTPLLMSAVDHAGAVALEGRYDEATAMFVDAVRRSKSLGDPMMARNIRMGLLPIARERLTVPAAALERYREDVGTLPGVPLEAIMLVSLLCDVGDLDEARRRLHALLGEPDVSAPGILRRYMLTSLAEAAATLRDVDAAKRLHDWLLEEQDGGPCVVVGAHCYFGALRRHLGRLALTMGDVDAAVEHHEEALHVHERMRARGWAARSRFDLSCALIDRRARGDRPRARCLLGEARVAAHELGMPKLLRELDEVPSTP